MPRCSASTRFSNPTDPTSSRDGLRRCSLPSAAAAAAITPDWRWSRDDTPYVGGDPINYLKFAREMRNFYAAHVREPMFPAVTKHRLMLTGDADVGISVTSIAFGLLTLVATYALGTPVGIARWPAWRRPPCSASITARCIGRSAAGATSCLPSSPCHAHGRCCGSRSTPHARMPFSPALSAAGACLTQDHDDRAHRACSRLAAGDVEFAAPKR